MRDFLSSIVLIGMGLYGVLLYLTNKLSLYIHPRFFEESFAASIVALLMGIVSLGYFVYKNKNIKQKSKFSINNQMLLILVLVILSFVINTLFLVIAAFLIIIPNKEFNKLFKSDVLGNLLIVATVLVGLILPPKSLSSITASQRSIDLNSINLTQNTISAVQNFNKSTSNYSLGDWISMQSFNPDPLYYKDKDVKISGFLYKPDNLNLPENVVLIARFVVTCCAVDARPVGLKVTLPENAEFKVDDWVEITGKFGLDDKNELIVITEGIVKIDIPSSPYIF